MANLSTARPHRLALIVLCLALIALGVPSGGLRLRAAPEIPESYKQVAENEQFQLYADAQTLAFKVVDKRSGYLWHSGLDALAQGDRLNRSWQAFAKSGISIEYLDERATNKRISITNGSPILAVTPIDQGLSAQVTFPEYGIGLTVNLQLEADGVRVEVPFTSIREENPKFRLGLLYLYPFLGATRGGSTPGYMFIPDGTGSLIRFADSTKAKNMFYGRYYGADLGMIGLKPYNWRVTDPDPISFPVFGMVHGEGQGQNAFLSIVDQGAAYGEVQAHPAGITTNFNFVYNAFLYNQSYFQPTNRSGAGVSTVQKQPNAFDVVVHYRFLTGAAADYVGMARSYQQYLTERGQLRTVSADNPNIGIRLEFLGGDKERVVFWDRFVPMTTIRQMREMLTALNVANPHVIYYGWQPYGASTMPPTRLEIDGNLGSMADLQALAGEIAAAGGTFSLFVDPQAALRDEPGYSPRTDTAMTITGDNIQSFSRFVGYYFLSLAPLRERFSALMRDFAAQPNGTIGTIGVALENIGMTLYSDFRQGQQLNREQAIRAYQSLLAETPAPIPMRFYRPNAYVFGLMDAYYDMPLGDNGYIYTSEAVPFLPIALSGHVPYYGAVLNFSPNLPQDLLRHADYGIYPSFYLTHEPTANMINTASSWIYTSSYAQWGEEARRAYTWLNALLGPVRGQAITARQQVAAGVFVTTYANGRQIVTNYTDRPFVYGGTTIAAKDASLVEKQP